MQISPRFKEYVFVGIIVFTCVVFEPNLYDNSHITRFITAAISLSLLFAWTIVKGKRLEAPNKVVCGLWFVLFLLFIISVAWSTNFAEAVFAMSKKIITALIVLVAYNFIVDYKDGAIKTFWLCCAIIATVYMAAVIVQMTRLDGSDFGQLYGVSGINGHKNLFSSIVLLLTGFMLAASAKAEKKSIRYVSIAYFVVAVVLIAILKSRLALGCVVSIVVVFAVICIVRKIKPVGSCKTRILTFCTSVLLLFMFVTIVLRNVTHISVPHTNQMSEIENKFMSTSSLIERFTLWEKSYGILDDKPLFGCGIGNWKIAFPGIGLKGLYRADVWNVTFLNPHNEFIETLSEGGYVIFLLFTMLVCYVAVNSFFAIIAIGDKKDFLFAAVVLSLFVAYYVNALFDFPSTRVEHLVMKGIITSFLLYFISKKSTGFSINLRWNYVFLGISIVLVLLGVVRMEGERNTCYMQGYIRANNWPEVEKHSDKALSPFYTIDPLGIPIHWYKGKAQSLMGAPKSISSFKLAYKKAPFCKENLNDLGLCVYFVENDIPKAEFYLKEAMRISPNFLSPYFNLTMIYVNEKRLSEAKTIVSSIGMDQYKKWLLIKDIPFYEPNNVENTKKRIEQDYETTVMLRHLVDSLVKAGN